MKRGLDLSLILACYNEEPVFHESVGRIIQILSLSRLTWEIIFVDDQSLDRTASLIQAACRRYPRCRAIYHPRNYGRGRSVADGIRAAKGTVVGYIDIDLEVSPIYIPSMAGMILDRKSDVVIGRRIYRSTFASLPREILSIGYQRLASRMVGTKGLDTESGYKFFHRKRILPILTRANHPHWFWDTQIIVYSLQAKLPIVEEPVLFRRRTDKKSSVRLVKDTANYWVHLWRLRKQIS